MVAVVEQTERGRKLTTATADPAPPGVGEDGFPERVWEVDGEDVTFSLKPYPLAERPVYWYTGLGALMWWRSQRQNEHGLQPVIQKECFVDGSFAPRNAWEEHMTRAFLRQKHVDPDKSRDERHPEGADHAWRCATCMFRCPSHHVMKAHQLKATHNGMLSE